MSLSRSVQLHSNAIRILHIELVELSARSVLAFERNPFSAQGAGGVFNVGDAQREVVDRSGVGRCLVRFGLDEMYDIVIAGVEPIPSKIEIRPWAYRKTEHIDKEVQVSSSRVVLMAA